MMRLILLNTVVVSIHFFIVVFLSLFKFVPIGLDIIAIVVICAFISLLFSKMKTRAAAPVRKRCHAKKKRSPMKKNFEAKHIEEEDEVVWFTNPSKEAARARRERAKQIMGRELWDTIMEDTSDDDEDEPDEEFYFYDGGWHSSPRPIKQDLAQDEQNQSEKDSQAFVFADEESVKDDVLGVEHNINPSLLKTKGNSDSRVMENDEIKTVASNKPDDPANDANYSTHIGSIGSEVETVHESDDLVVEVAAICRHDILDVQEITRNVVGTTAVAVLFQPNDLEEQRNEGLDNQQRQDEGHHNDAEVAADDCSLELRMTSDDAETAKEVSLMTKGETNESSVGPSSQAMVVSNNEHLGGQFKQKFRCWKRYAGRKLRRWSAKIRTLITPCCINTRTEKAQSK